MATAGGLAEEWDDDEGVPELPGAGALGRKTAAIVNHAAVIYEPGGGISSAEFRRTGRMKAGEGRGILLSAKWCSSGWPTFFKMETRLRRLQASPMLLSRKNVSLFLCNSSDEGLRRALVFFGVWLV